MLLLYLVDAWRVRQLILPVNIPTHSAVQSCEPDKYLIFIQQLKKRYTSIEQYKGWKVCLISVKR